MSTSNKSITDIQSTKMSSIFPGKYSGSDGYNSNNTKENVSGFFLDMAEIWECYVRAIINKALTCTRNGKCGIKYTLFWTILRTKKSFPDIVTKKRWWLLRFDARYKDMQYRRVLLMLTEVTFFFKFTLYFLFTTQGACGC